MIASVTFLFNCVKIFLEELLTASKTLNISEEEH